MSSRKPQDSRLDQSSSRWHLGAGRRQESQENEGSLELIMPVGNLEPATVPGMWIATFHLDEVFGIKSRVHLTCCGL